MEKEYLQGIQKKVESNNIYEYNKNKSSKLPQASGMEIILLLLIYEYNSLKFF